MHTSPRMPRSLPGVRMLAVVLASASFFLPAAVRAATGANRVAQGTWGGAHIVMEVSEKGAEIELDCGRGQVSQPMALHQHGNFDVAGTFTTEHGGPVLRDEDTTPAAVRYTGHVAGDTMSLTITRGEEKLGSFTLTHGLHPRLIKCR